MNFYLYAEILKPHLNINPWLTNCFVYLNFVSWNKLKIPCIIDIYKRKKWELNEWKEREILLSDNMQYLNIDPFRVILMHLYNMYTSWFLGFF